MSLAIDSFPTSKSPGPEGYTSLFYKRFTEQLIPMLKEVFNLVSGDILFVDQTQEAYITVLPKPNEDQTQCANYRPISLINLDLKIHAKLIANRLRSSIPFLIHLDEVGFVPHREARDNTIKSVNIINYAKKQKTSLCIISIDAENMFDRPN